ncbi:MAG: hypothetical protein ACQKBV_00280 [Puniceicoccales bacterium]
MFKRILYDEWTGLVPIASFCLTFGVFLIITLRAFLFKKAYVRHMGDLPLADDETPTETTDER